MSKISKAVEAETKKKKYDVARHTSETEINFMGGESYTCDPLTTLKLVTASSIYGEPSYYRDGGLKDQKTKDSYLKKYDWRVKLYGVIDYTNYEGKTTTQVMETVIDEALAYDFKATLEWAVELRTTYNMRLNPQVIMTRAAIHPDRQKFTEAYPGLFNEYNQKVMQRADEPMSQLAYFLHINSGKANMPTILKNSIAKKLSKLKRYQVAKYKNHEIGMIDAVRLTHANSPVIDELMQTGTVVANEDEMTWENLRSQGMGWKEIVEKDVMGHMALLRNLRGVFTEVEDVEFCKMYLEKLKSGVATGKQFPFRYWSAIKAINLSSCNHKPLIFDALEECMDLAVANVPKLKGKTMALSDNSGSAWGSIPSEYGTVRVAEIDNLSAVMMAVASDEGYVGAFGDKLKIFPISKRNGMLTQTKDVNEVQHTIGGGTENGIWLFFRDAIDKKIWYDNIVIFSDQQAGHGGLYGTYAGIKEYKERGFCTNESYVNVMDLIIEYRKKVNPKVNVMSVQTAGYTNITIPENIYRGTIAYGWTGQEIKLLKATIDIWDEVENNQQRKQNIA